MQLDDTELIRVIEDAYELNLIDIEKIKNVYKIKTANKEYCLKVIKYNFDHFLFILGAIRHLQHKGFNTILEIIKPVNGNEYIMIDGKYCYLTPWVTARECNYDNPVDIVTASMKLAELHVNSEGFTITDNMRPRVGWFKWIEVYRTRRSEILDFKHRIYNKDCRTEFDELYLKIMAEELYRAERAVSNLDSSDYLQKMYIEVEKKGFCHHDYAHHNVLIEENGSVDIIDFDYCILDSHLHDLSSLLLRRMKNGKWDLENARAILNSYNSVKGVEQSDIPIISAFMEFPQDYWQVGIQYYWEKQPWEEEYFLKKLSKIAEDRDEKQEFIDEFRYLRYRG